MAEDKKELTEEELKKVDGGMAPNSPWECKKCGTMNSYYATKCANCGKRK